MSYKLDSKDINITGKRLTKIGTGTTGDVYKYKNNALKIFKKEQKPPIDYETARYLTNIKTERILLPRNLLFYNQSFTGYTYKLVSKKGSGQRLIMLPREDLESNVKAIEKDTKTLSGKKVLLNGIEPSNCIYNGILYVADPREYSILEEVPTKDLERLNKYQIHMLLTSLIISEIRKANLGNEFERKIKELLESREIDEDSSMFFKELLKPGESIKQLSKKNY